MNANQHQFAMFVDVHEVPALVVGGGPVAVRKTRRLLGAGAVVTVVAQNVSKEMAELHSQQEIALKQKNYEQSDIDDAAIVIAATSSVETNNEIAVHAKAAGAHVNVANNPSAGSFIMPSMVDRSPLLIAISSGGASPVLSRLLTARIEAFIPGEFAKLAALAGSYRDEIKKALAGWRERRRFWEQQLGGRVGELMMQGNESAAHTTLEKEISQYQSKGFSGEVYLVGAGPGDPDLLTFRAIRLMQHADVVFYDRLVSDSVMALVKPDAERIYVGKRRSDHAVPQESINEQMVKHAKQGQRVLRLKGGDPFIFGRGGEEIEEMAKHGIAFQVVPGITAAAGCASYAGIPLTHRDYSQACLFVTGHLKDGSVDLNWQALVQPNQTVVIYMGLVGLPVIVEKLIEHGMDASTPIALISCGTTQNQTVVQGNLSDIAQRVSMAEVKAPTLTIIGEVVNLREKLSWFEPSA